jgi:hypothetical protein
MIWSECFNIWNTQKSQRIIYDNFQIYSTQCERKMKVKENLLRESNTVPLSLTPSLPHRADYVMLSHHEKCDWRGECEKKTVVMMLKENE